MISQKAKLVLSVCLSALVSVSIVASLSNNSENIAEHNAELDSERRLSNADPVNTPFSLLTEREGMDTDNIRKNSAQLPATDVGASPRPFSINAAVESATQQRKTQDEIDREEMDPASESNHQMRLEQGFSSVASRALSTKSGETTVSIFDMPPEIQNDLLSASRDIAELGYEEVEYEFLRSIAEISLSLIDDAELERVAAFDVTTPDEKFTEGYELLGVSYPGAGTRVVGDNSVETISHTFTSLDTTNALHLEQTSLVNGSTIILTEFANSVVQNYPAYFRVYRNSQSREEVSGITWVDENFDTTLYYIGAEPAEARDYLLKKANILQISRAD